MFSVNANELLSRGARVDRYGPFEGKITEAKLITAKSGAKGVEFKFVSQYGESARFTLYTNNRNGEPIVGMYQLQEIMVCLGLKDASISPVRALVEEYDYGQQSYVQVQREILPDLMNKPIGIIFNIEEFEKQNGTLGERTVFHGAFQAGTRLTDKEILRGKTIPENFDRKVNGSRFIPIQTKASAQRATSAAIETSSSFPDDDIPF